MRRISLFFLAISASLGVSAQSFETASEAVANMGVGWNLGNTLEAYQQYVDDVDDDDYWNGQGLESETCWGQSITQPGLMKMMKNAGFGAIRVPVTWFNHIDKDGNVDAAWMKRVHEVVDYVIDNGMYCILNIHHDTGADNKSYASWMKADEAIFAKNQQRYENLVKQIAEEFKTYDERLLFEGYNEMLDVKNSWCYASYAASGNYDASIATSAYNAINSYAQSFVNTVRATGGNNAERNLVVNTYAAACGSGNWNAHLQEPLSYMKLPEDKVANHIAFEVHYYPQIANHTMYAVNNELKATFKSLNTYLVSQGAPVIIGEWGTSNVDASAGKTDYDLRRSLMLEFADSFVKLAKENNMATFYWMGLSDGLYRDLNYFNQPDLAETMIKAYYGEDFDGDYPSLGNVSSLTCFEGEKEFAWGNGVAIAGDVFKDLGKRVQIEMIYTISKSDDDIQLYYGDWSKMVEYVVDGESFKGDINPSIFYGKPVGTQITMTIDFDETTYDALATRGLIIHGAGVKMESVVLTKVGTDVPIILSDGKVADGPCYNVLGQKTVPSEKRAFIQNGKKYMIIK